MENASEHWAQVVERHGPWLRVWLPTLGEERWVHSASGDVRAVVPGAAPARSPGERPPRPAPTRS